MMWNDVTNFQEGKSHRSKSREQSTWWQRHKLLAALQIQLLQLCKLTYAGRQRPQGHSLLHYEPDQTCLLYTSPSPRDA